MRKVDSILRSINRRMDEIQAAFSGKTNENQKISAILGAVGDLQAIMRYPAGKPARLSRSKKVIAAIESNPQLHQKLDAALDAMQEMGTVKQLVSKYLSKEEMKDWRRPAVMERLGRKLIEGKGTEKERKIYESALDAQANVRQRAFQEFEANFNDDDRYMELQETIDDAATRGDNVYYNHVRSAVEAIRKKPGHGHRGENYDEMVMRLDRAKRRKEQIMSGDFVSEAEGEYIELGDEIDPSLFDMSL